MEVIVRRIGLSPFLPSGVTNERTTVVNAGGFYIARYETGGGLVSKKGVVPWTQITQANSKIQAKKFINNQYVKSALISDVQWDLVMNFVNGKKDGRGQYFNVNNPSSTRHTGASNVSATGQNNADLVCNIYDLEGNAQEYSTGVGHQPQWPDMDWVYQRGGYYVYTTNWSGRASGRTACLSSFYPSSTSFRMVLYVMK